MDTCACASTAAFCNTSHFCLHRLSHAASLLLDFFLTPNFLYTQRLVGRDSDDIYREFSSDVCKLRMLHCEVEGGMSEYEITGCLRAQRELRRTDSTSPWQHSSTRQVAVHGAESKPASGRKQRGRDAGALRSADKESQLYPHGLMLLIL